MKNEQALFGEMCSVNVLEKHKQYGCTWKCHTIKTKRLTRSALNAVLSVCVRRSAFSLLSIIPYQQE